MQRSGLPQSQSGDRAGEQGDGGVLGFIGVAGLAHVITMLEVVV
jgi:hypothetical protein